jgi:hypothetical protein
MHWVIRLLLIFVTINFNAYGHGDGDLRVELEPEDTSVVKNREIEFRFQLVDTKQNNLVDDDSLRISHEKKLHLIAYDPALKEFRHLHPVAEGDTWKVQVQFDRSGDYWFWAQGELIDGTEFSSPARVKVRIDTPAWPTPPALSDVRSGSDGTSVVSLSGEKLKAGKMAMLNVTLSRSDGTTPSITPYLGAFAHVVAVFEDADSLIHVHPMDTSNPNQGMLHATFPHKGAYRLWIQFIDGGQLRTVPLSVKVN